jgi:hypothetical protein
MVFPVPSLGPPVSDGFPPHIDPKLLPNKFQNLLADYGGRLPVTIARGDSLTIKVTFEHKGPPFFCKVGAGLNITTDARFLRPDVSTALWLSENKFIGPSLGWEKQEVILKGKFGFEGKVDRDTIDVLKAIQVPFRELNIDGEKMLLADWDRDVYRVGERPLPSTRGQPRLTASGEGAAIRPIGLPRLTTYGEGAAIRPIGLPRLTAYGEGVPPVGGGFSVGDQVNYPPIGNGTVTYKFSDLTYNVDFGDAGVFNIPEADLSPV